MLVWLIDVVSCEGRPEVGASDERPSFCRTYSDSYILAESFKEQAFEAMHFVSGPGFFIAELVLDAISFGVGIELEDRIISSAYWDLLSFNNDLCSMVRRL